MNPPSVYLVERDPDQRDALHRALASAGYDVVAYSSTARFLADYHAEWNGCLIVAQELSRMSGLELLARLREGDETPLPGIVIAADADIPAAVTAIKLGAVEFMVKPIDTGTLLHRVDSALQVDARRRKRRRLQRDLQAKHDRLTPREVETLDLIRRGLPNKAMAAQLGITERAVEMRRAGIMKKMGADSIAELLESVISLRLLRGDGYLEETQNRPA